MPPKDTQGEVRHFQKGKVVMMTEGLPLVHSKDSDDPDTIRTTCECLRFRQGNMSSDPIYQI